MLGFRKADVAKPSHTVSMKFFPNFGTLYHARQNFFWRKPKKLNLYEYFFDFA